MDEVTAEHRRTRSVSVTEALRELDEQLVTPGQRPLSAFRTGFEVLDDVLGGGLHRGELVLLGGPPGVGKTITALQWARNLARGGVRCVFACYEHEPRTLLTRLLALEVGALDSEGDLPAPFHMAGQNGNLAALSDLLAADPLGRRALDELATYGDDLLLVRASGSHTTLERLEELIEEHGVPGRPTVLFVDYLQKVPLQPEPDTESEKVTRTVEGLKDLALGSDVPLVLLSAVDAAGMRANRLRLHHLRGSSAIAFESDVVVMLNDKQKAVSKVHLTYDPVRARGYRDWVVFSVEKNRGGPTLVDLEFRKDFHHFRFDPQGGMVSEQLVSERLDDDAL